MNRAVALAQVEGPEAALRVVDELERDDRLSDYHYVPAIRADLLRRLGRLDEALLHALLAREELAAILAKAETREEETETLEVETEAPAVDPQVLPPSVAKANKTDQRKGFLARLADTYHGEGGEEE